MAECSKRYVLLRWVGVGVLVPLIIAVVTIWLSEGTPPTSLVLLLSTSTCILGWASMKIKVETNR